MMRNAPGLRHRLERNCQRVKTELREQGYPLSVAPTPIIVHYPSTQTEIEATRERLLSLKILPSLIEYPGGPRSRLLPLCHLQRAHPRSTGRFAESFDHRLIDTFLLTGRPQGEEFEWVDRHRQLTLAHD